MGPMPEYVKPRADRDWQTRPCAHVGICHTYLTTCVICREKSVTFPTVVLSERALDCPTSGVIYYASYPDEICCVLVNDVLNE